jgi:hypothetical protein
MAYSLSELIAWLEKQPQDKLYDWSDAGICVLGQFAAAMGAEDAELESLALSNIAPFDDIALNRPYTFGDALKRARNSLSTSQQVSGPT